MRSGVKIVEEAVGTGIVAVRGMRVRIRYQLRLNRGDEIQRDIDCSFTLGRREVIAGLEYAVEGMRVGGNRVVRVSPHLAYRDCGIPGMVPANAVLVFEVELLEAVPQTAE